MKRIYIPYVKITKILLLFIIIVELVYISYSVVNIVKAFTTIGCKWNSPPYPNLSYRNVCDGMEHNAVETSISDWEGIGASNPPNFYPTSSNWKIYINETYKPGVVWDGLARILCRNGWIDHVNITINEYYTSSYVFNKVRSVTGHELGHALGLGDEYWLYPVLMNGVTYYRYDVYGVYKPTYDEVTGIEYLYGHG